jgi:hypothetical protein
MKASQIIKLDTYPGWEIQSGCWGSGTNEFLLGKVVILVCRIISEIFSREVFNNISVKIIRGIGDKPRYMQKEANPKLIVEHDAWINITVEGNRYAEFIFQLAHEMCHTIIRSEQKKTKFEWLSEVLCGAISFIALEKSILLWKKSASLKSIKKCESKIPYWFCLQGYLDRLLELEDLKHDESYKDFYFRLKQSFENDPVGPEINGIRPRNDVLSKVIYKQLIKSNGWTAVKYIDKIEKNEETTIEQYFGAWVKHCNVVDEIPFILDIAHIIGIEPLRNT